MQLLPLNCMASWIPPHPSFFAPWYCPSPYEWSSGLGLRLVLSVGAHLNYSWGFFKIQVTRSHLNLLDLLRKGPRVCVFFYFYFWSSIDNSDVLFRWRTPAQDAMPWIRDGFCSQFISSTSTGFFLPDLYCYGTRGPTCLALESPRVVIVVKSTGRSLNQN